MGERDKSVDNTMSQPTPITSHTTIPPADPLVIKDDIYVICAIRLLHHQKNESRMYSTGLDVTTVHVNWFHNLCVGQAAAAEEYTCE